MAQDLVTEPTDLFIKFSRFVPVRTFKQIYEYNVDCY
jgi:hypothetical protein